MEWEITEGPEEVNPGGVDATIWRWRVSDGSETRAIFVKVSRTAMACDDDTLPNVTRLAKQTKGKSAVEGFLDWFEPPRSLALHTASEEPHPEGGMQDPSSDDPEEAASIQAALDWFQERGVILDVSQQDGGWIVLMIPPGFKVGSLDVGRGSSILAALEDAQARYKPRVIEVTGTVTAKVSAAAQEEVTSATERDIRIVGEEATLKLAALAFDFKRTVGWIRLSEDSWMLAIGDKDGNVIDILEGDNLDDLYLEAYDEVVPPQP